MALPVEDIKKLRQETGAGVMDCRRALEEFGGDAKKAAEKLRQTGLAKAEKRADRETGDGLIFSYTHAGGKVGSLVELRCETDFVARTAEFQALGRELALQVAAMGPESVEDLLEQEYIRDPGRKIKDLVVEVTAKTGENVKIGSLARRAI